MPIHVQWDNNTHTILRITYEGEWERDDLIQAVDQLTVMITSVQHPVDMVIDATKNRVNPLKVISVLGYMELKIAPNQRLVIVVGFNRLIKIVLDVAKRVAPRTAHNVFLADTLADAYAMIAAHDNGDFSAA